MRVITSPFPSRLHNLWHLLVSLENYPCKQTKQGGGGEQGMAALCCISNLNLLEESSDKHQSQLKVVGESVQTWMLWVNLSRQSSPTQLLSHSPPWDGERVGRIKVWKIIGWDKNSLIGKVKVVHTSKAKQGIHSLLPIGRQVFSHLRKAGLHHA